MHDHSHEHEHFNTAFAWAVAINFGFTLIEAFYGLMANSMSLLADAGHNMGDVLGLCLAWGANWLLSKPSSVRYSYGYKRTTILAAIANAVILVGTAAIIGFESIVKLFNPEPVQELTVIIVAVIGIAINGGTALLFMKGSKSDLNIKGAFLHLAYDALISVGVVVAGTIIFFTGKEWVDPITGFLIVLIIIAGSWELMRSSALLLLDAVPDSINQEKVAAYFSSIQGVTALHDLHIWGLSTKEIALTAHLIMPDMRLTDEDFHKINHDLKENFNIDHVTIQVETGSEAHPCHLESTCDSPTITR